MWGVLIAVTLVGGLVKLAFREATEPVIKPTVEKIRLAYLAGLSPSKVTYVQAWDGVVLSRRLGERELEKKFATIVRAHRKSGSGAGEVFKMNPLWFLIPIALGTAFALSSKAEAAERHDPLMPSSAWAFTPVVPYDLSRPATFKHNTEYPELMRALAQKWAPVFSIPESWLISQAYAESQNRPLALNRSGATGILQIKLIRARDLVKWIGRSKWKTHPKVRKMLASHWHDRQEDLYNPNLNTMLAAFDLNHLRAKFGNSHDLVAAAYNQGEGRISRHLAAKLPLPPGAVEYIARVAKAKRRGYV